MTEENVGPPIPAPDTEPNEWANNGRLTCQSSMPLSGLIRGKNRVRQERRHGTVRGVPGNRHPYRDPPGPELDLSPTLGGESSKVR